MLIINDQSDCYHLNVVTKDVKLQSRSSHPDYGLAKTWIAIIKGYELKYEGQKFLP